MRFMFKKQSCTKICQLSAPAPCAPLLVIAVFAISAFEPAYPDQNAAPTFNNVREVLSAAKTASNDDERLKILKHLNEHPAATREDAEALYNAADDARKEYTNDTQGRMALWKSEAVSSALAQCTQPVLHPVIADLLEKQRKALPKNYAGTWGTTGVEELNKESFRYRRLYALMSAAADGKNHDALPTLRKMAEVNDVAGGLAMETIAKIGDPVDLDIFIERAKKDLHASIDVGPFGLQALQKIVSQIPNSPKASTEEQGLISLLGQFKTRDALLIYLPLLKYKNPVVVGIAARAISNILGPGDEKIVNEMVNDKNSDVRSAGLGVLGDKLWSAKQIPFFIQILQNDRDPISRSNAAYVLGQHKVYSARPVLQTAAKQDSLYMVRSSAQSALDWMDQHK